MILIGLYILVLSSSIMQQDEQNQFQQHVNEQNWPAIKEMVYGYMNSEAFIAHTAGYAILPEIMKYPELLDISEELVQKCIQENTPDNLRRLGEENATEQKQYIDYVYYYSQYAWILWKKCDYAEADTMIDKSMDYQDKTGAKPGAQELLRLGIIKYYNDNNEGWALIKQALLAEYDIEKQDADYEIALNKIITAELGNDTNPEGYIDAFRQENRQAAPELVLVSFKDDELEIINQSGRILFINFFSPNCGSCRQELPKVKEIYDEFAGHPDVLFLFILDKPDMKNESLDLFQEIGYENAPLYTVKSHSAWDYIRAEPTIWILDRDGRFAYKHTGYQPGIEETFRKELDKILKNGKAIH